MQEQEQNRTEQATPFKLSEAKKRGQVAKSLDFNTLIMIGGLLASMAIVGGTRWVDFGRLSAELFAGSGSLGVEMDNAMTVFDNVGWRTLDVVLPFMMIGVLTAIAGNLVQTGFIFSGEPIKPKFERINPVAGFKRVFNKRMLFEAFKSVIKLIFLGAIAYAFFLSAIPDASTLGSSPDVHAQWLGENALELLFRLTLGLLLVGLIDIAYVRWQFGQQMMMSTREVKEEVKRREGDPMIRAKIRELQRENLKQARSMGRLPDADVLITNPTHFAVALHYDRATMNAPVVVAKGSDKWVVELKALARQHGIPILERKALARLLFKDGQIDQPIPGAAFVDVARVYAELARQRRVGESAGRFEVA